jgi:hypothetical protein
MPKYLCPEKDDLNSFAEKVAEIHHELAEREASKTEIFCPLYHRIVQQTYGGEAHKKTISET